MWELLRCRRCGAGLQSGIANQLLTCECKASFRIQDGIVEYTDANILDGIAEVAARNRQAQGYLDHAKFPTQVFRVKRFLACLPAWTKARPTIELGCGPGPYTKHLMEAGHRVIAVDFSQRSLELNREAIGINAPHVCFVRADLTELQIESGCSNVLLMCDFLQHIDGHHARSAFIRNAFEWLAPGGYFYLSFFNFNLVNFLKGDLRGSFSDGATGYERLILREVLRTLPVGVLIDAVTPLNIFHAAGPDRLAAKLPGSLHLCRMLAISGRKSDI